MGLAYESQRESASDRTRRRAMRLQHVMDGNGRPFDSGPSDERLEHGDFDEHFAEDQFDEDLAEGGFDGTEGDIGNQGNQS